jgi:hypothetical protein
MVQKLVFQHIIFRHMYSSETQSFAMKYRLKIKFYFETLSTSEQEVIPLTEEVFFYNNIYIILLGKCPCVATRNNSTGIHVPRL